MTFLEYVTERLLGPPVRCSDGRSTWHCPFHQDEHPSFCTLPPKRGCKDRFRCFGCGAWGDEYDLMKLFYDNENFGDRKARLDLWREDWKREARIEPANKLHRGSGSTAAAQDDPRDVESAFANLAEVVERAVPPWAVGNSALYRLIAHSADVAWSANVSLDSLASYCAEFLIGQREMLKRHAATCTDPNCGDECRAERGLPPLSQEERARQAVRANGKRKRNRRNVQ